MAIAFRLCRFLGINTYSVLAYGLLVEFGRDRLPNCSTTRKINCASERISLSEKWQDDWWSNFLETAVNGDL